MHGEDDEGGGDDVADSPGAQGDAAERVEPGFEQGVGAFGRGSQGSDELVAGPVVDGPGWSL